MNIFTGILLYVSFMKINNTYKFLVLLLRPLLNFAVNIDQFLRQYIKADKNCVGSGGLREFGQATCPHKASVSFSVT